MGTALGTGIYEGNWSFSSLMVYETCPLRFKLARIDKLKELPRPDDNPMERGNRIHNRLELYVKGESNEMDTEARCIDAFVPAIDHARHLYSCKMATAEENWLFDRDWEETPRDAGRIWLWSKLDLSVMDEKNGHIISVDYKSGKSLYKAVEHVQQLQLYAAISALKYEWAETITSELWYLDEGGVKTFTVTRDEALAFVGRFDQRAQRAYDDRFFRANPNAQTCRYCPYGPKAGTGACPVGV